ncbi:MAG: ATP-binding protein, partial [Streptococcus sp.]|nr:ATP-binding protein [Streptococcus sp.]
MTNKELLNVYGLKWNPFSFDLPKEALQTSNKIDSFCFRVESLLIEGGYAMITGHPGTGKSVALRILSQRLSKLNEVRVGNIVRPQSGVADFYRELGDLFGMELKTSNRWMGYKGLRKKWIEHIQSTLFRAVLLIDEAQEMPSLVLNELRLISSYDLDAKTILTIVFCGDTRLPEKFKSPELIPLGSRIRTRLKQEPASKEELLTLLKMGIEKAGNPKLMTT